MIIEKPFGTTLEEARELNRRVLAIFDETPGLPHRPLPRQGDRPEHAGVPLRQRHVRAAVEPQLHRQRADHRGRGHRHRHARGLLRPRRRAARPDPEPHAAAALPRGDGAARELHRRRGAQREGQGAATRSPQPTPQRDRRRWPCAPSTAAGHAGGEDVAGYLEEEGVPPDSTTETYAAMRLEVDNWRWAGVPFYLRTGKRLARKVTEIAVTLKPVPHLAFSQDGSLGVQPNQLVLTRAAQRGRLAAARREDPRHAHDHPPGEHGVPVRHLVPVAVAGGLRAADHRRDARRRDAVHAQRRGRGAVAHLRPDRQQPGTQTARAAAAVRSRLAGARGGRRSCCARAIAGARSDGRAATRSGASRERRPTRSKRRCASCWSKRHAESAELRARRAC